MAEHLARLALLSATLGGCSLLYDPDELPPAAEGPPPPDLDACQLEVDDVAPAVIFEGMGVGGSRPAVLVISGRNLVSQRARVSIAAAAGASRAPLEYDGASVESGAYGGHLAMPITLPVDIGFAAGQSVKLDVTVTQDCAEGPRTATIAGGLELRGLEELDDRAGPKITLVGGLHEYSRIELGAATTLGGTAGQAMPVMLRSTSSVKIANAISVDAAPTPPIMATDPWPGGPAGGAGGLGGSGLGTGGAGGSGGGPYPGGTAGSPGRFDSPDLGLARFLTSTQNRSSGGAGGDGAVIGGEGGHGGGGGGAIEIVAAGNLEVAAISARGIGGQDGTLNGQKGGGGSGGVIILRAGQDLKAAALDVAGGGTGHKGRARYDAGGAATVESGELGAGHYRGPMFVDPPLTTRVRAPELTVIGKPLAGFRYFTIDAANAASQIVDEMLGADGTARITLKQALAPGSNQICLVVEGGDGTSDTRNCIHIAYVR